MDSNLHNFCDMAHIFLYVCLCIRTYIFYINISPSPRLKQQIFSFLPSLQKSSQKADEYLREIKEQSMLREAVDQCVEAAGHEYDPITQKSLLRVRTVLCSYSWPSANVSAVLWSSVQ